MKKFELSEEKNIDNDSTILYRIRACKDFTTHRGKKNKSGIARRICYKRRKSFSRRLLLDF